MAAPTFTAVEAGATDAGGAWGPFPITTAVGQVFIFQALQDGTTDGAIGFTFGDQVANLAGTDSAATQIVGPNADGSWPIGSAANARQFLWIGRKGSGSVASVSGTNSTSEDLYLRTYYFNDVSTGTTLATVIENGVALDTLLGTAATADSVQGASGTAEMLGQPFTPTASGNINQVSAILGTSSSPSDNLIIEIQSDSAGSPSGTSLGNVATVAGGSLSTTLTTFTYSFTPVAVTGGTQYWLVFRRDGARDTTNYFRIGDAGTTIDASAVGKASSSGTWSSLGTTIHALVSGTAGTAAYHSATTGTISDVAVTTLGPDRLALNFVGINDDNAIPVLSQATGQGWAEPTIEYADATGTDASIGIQGAWPASISSGPGGGLLSVGAGTTTEKQAQQFTTSVALTITDVTFTVLKSGAPADNLIIEIQSDSAGVPSGSVVGTATVAASTLTTSLLTYRVSLSASLSAATTYHLVFSRSGALNGAQFYQIGTGSSDSLTDAGWGTETYTTGAWSETSTNELSFALHTATDISAGATIDGGTATNVDATDGWGVVGFALIGTTVVAESTSYSKAGSFMEIF